MSNPPEAPHEAGGLAARAGAPAAAAAPARADAGDPACPDPLVPVTWREIARQTAAGPPRDPGASAVDALAAVLAAEIPCRVGPSCTRRGIPRMRCGSCREDAYTAALAAAAVFRDLARGQGRGAGDLAERLLTAPPAGPACGRCGRPVFFSHQDWWHCFSGALAYPPGPGRAAAEARPGPGIR